MIYRKKVQELLLEKNKNYIKPLSRVRTLQQAMPNAKLYESGMMGFKNHIYSSTYMIEDVDFASGSEEEQEDFFKLYEEVLNGLDTNNITYKLTLFNRSNKYQDVDYLLQRTDYGDGYDRLRKEYNTMRKDNWAKSSGMVRERYLTVVADVSDSEYAEKYFQDFVETFNKSLEKLGTNVSRMNIRDRMEVLYDFYRIGDEEYYDFDFETSKKRRSSWKDYLCPNNMHFRHKYFEMGDKFGCVLFMKDWGSSLKVQTLSELMKINTNMMISVDIIPLSSETINRLLEDAEMSAESNLDRWQRRPGADQRRYSKPPFRMVKDQQIVSEYNNDVMERNQRIFLSNVTAVVLGNTYQEMKAFAKQIINTASGCGCKFSELAFQQLPGLNTVLPYGPRWITNLRDVTTENQAVMMPFDSVGMNHPSGIPYGVHEDTKQEMLIDRRLLSNGNEWVIGVSGSGKSMRVKITAILETLLTDGDIIFVDPHGEYVHLTRALGGQVITLGTGSNDVINVMDMCQGYGDGDDVRRKMELLVAFFHAALGTDFTRSMESILMRCSQRIYNKYVGLGYTEIPTLQTLYEMISDQPEEVAHELTLYMEQMMIGAMSCFNGMTNVNMYSRVLCFDISQMDNSVWDAGMTVIMDAIQNRLVLNHNSNKPTYIKIDEVGRFLNDTYLSRLFERFYSETRKYGGYITGIVQNISKLLFYEAARNMLSNSEIVVMFRQSQIDAAELRELYNLSKEQAQKLVSATEGCGLFKCGNQFINFDGRIEKGVIYDLADTKPKHEF